MKRIEEEIKNTGANKGSPLAKAVLFIMPSVVVTLVSIVLFLLLTNFTMEQHMVFVTTIISATILSLFGVAAVQLLTYRIIGEDAPTPGPVYRSIRTGTAFVVPYCAIVLGALYPYFHSTLGFSLLEFAYLVVLTLLYSLIWVVTAVFWATEKYSYPAVIFGFAYLSILALTYGAHLAAPEYTIAGFTVGVAMLLLLSWFSVRTAFGKETQKEAPEKFPSGWEIAQRNVAAIVFNILYVFAIFLDKIIVWVSQAQGQGLAIHSPYTVGSFLGMIPVFSIAAMAYFSSKARLLVKDLHKGSLYQIEGTTRKYRRMYWNGFGMMLASGLALFAVVSAVALYVLDAEESFKVMATISVGILFFAIIVYNSAVLPLFGKMYIPMISMLVVVIAEVLTIPLVSQDIWYAALGFLVGSILGAIISQVSVIRLFVAFEYSIFRSILENA